MTLLVVAIVWTIGSLSVLAQTGELDLTILDKKTRDPIPVRIRIEDGKGRAPLIRKIPRLGNDFTFRDLLTFKMKMGKYNFTINRGPHYQERTGWWEVKRNGFDQKTLELPRFVDMHKEGWYSGDLLVARERDHLDVLLDAEELDFVVAPSWQVSKPVKKLSKDRSREIEAVQNRFVDFSGGVLSQDGRYLATGLKEETLLSEDTPNLPPAFARYVREHGGKLHVLDPYAWDLPQLVAEGNVDSVAVLPDALRLDGDVAKFAGRALKDTKYQGKHGIGKYAQAIYFHLLNCGLRIAPSACSSSGECKNPPGYNRVYVACGQYFNAKTWWENLLEGKSIVSNGPVLRVRANDQLPGYVFRGEPGATVKLTISCNLGTRQKVEYLEIIQNGLVTESVRLDEWAKANGKLPPIEFEQSGWFCVRAYAPGEENYRVALSAPFYVDFGTPRVSKKSAQFFVEWVYDQGRRIQASKLAKSEKLIRLRELKAARDYWQRLAQSAEDG